MTVSREWIEAEVFRWAGGSDTSRYCSEMADALRELAALRAADDGAVTVEGQVKFESKRIVALSDVPDDWRGELVTIRRKP